MTVATVSKQIHDFCEVLPIKTSELQLMCFRLTPEVDKKDGNRLSYHFSRKLPGTVIIWQKPYFWVLAASNRQLPNKEEFQEALSNIQKEVEDFRECLFGFQSVRQPQITPLIISLLTVQILNKTKFEYPEVYSDNGVIVRREPDFWTETIELNENLTPAITLTVFSSIIFRDNLAEFYEKSSLRQKPEQLLIDLKVQEIERGNTATIVGIVGTIAEHREKLLEKATGSISKQALRDAPDEQPIVAVQFGKDSKQFHYPMAALRPCVTSETANQFDVDYGKILKTTKIPHEDRTNLLVIYKKTAEEALKAYGIKLERSTNSIEHKNLFWKIDKPLTETKLLFGNQFVGKRGEILTGFKKGGVYRRQADYEDKSKVIQIAALKLCDCKVNPFINLLKQRLKLYGFQSEVITKKDLQLNDLTKTEARAKVEKAVNELAEIPHDIVLGFLPKSDRNTDYTDEGSFYHQIYSLLLRRQIASQMIYEDTLVSPSNYQYILNQVVPGILAKLGNLPFILGEPLEIADYFVGLDISRISKKRQAGTRNACASIRLYGRQGEFVRYRLEDDLIDGETIPPKLLERLLPAAELENKTVLIYRDGSFVGREADYLVERAKAINAQFILVECKKSGVPRLYNLEKIEKEKKVIAPPQGLALRLSSREAVLVTTKVPDEVGLARPLRLTIHEQGHQVPIESVLETTLKLTLLHHGALKEPRLPMPLYGSDRMAYLRLQGIRPSLLEGDKQFWL
ncbi:stem cell self-renewal protein Piwi [Anabaena cylindrica FACHB-243]|uniref:Protein argonaute n=1 Tax=Anabaena cylindrica (strain ATCC 27899 / PCC 7122) TaxID=272123 RepID=K9ZDE3_ANACC|nr:MULTISPECIES: Piwi domain-containing protein [Anabaena]AFZ56749.1 stem cell self-renewal protein Piwi [Anabaena cylindrica PCC 7122]MBD2420343.1 stem cell self-renewal protein Piwi [Anabaena cylindrica FACHB-243]MBY5281754.1 stem cell self-renewal protein Piwi [Anabaena sp. CCAP 1446/1C]MBY5306632.1 stem cell self-renewal protein Piwi [Anabaena sp. CCAP 1446/1C]MCM2407844.1 stem cell self-renewal protein Piwi [Anabaena sp. CCAP 1446/1C]